MEELNYDDILINPKKAEEILLQEYGIKGIASPLPGEYDMNFKICIDTKDSYILKISRPGVEIEELDFQQKLLQHLTQNKNDLLAPEPISNLSSCLIANIFDDFGRQRYVRLLSWIPGRMYHQVNPQRDSLRLSLGLSCGKLTKTLEGFDHANAHRIFEWDLAASLWTCSHLDLFNEDEQRILHYFQHRFKQ